MTNMYFAFLLLYSPLITAFVGPYPETTWRNTASSHQLSMVSSRRDVLMASTAAALLLPVSRSRAETTIDYSLIQDLLGTDATTYAPEPGKRPTYLAEPTEEFKQSESKSADFKRLTLQKKAEFKKLLEVIETASNDETLLSETLDNMTRFVRSNGGLPEGLTKEEVVKTCRRRKAKKYWPTRVEVSYQDLLLEIAYQQSPNTGRDTYQRL